MKVASRDGAHACALGKAAPPRLLAVQLGILFRMAPGRVTLAMGFGGGDLGCAWMMITRRAGRMLARSISPWVIGVCADASYTNRLC